MLKFYLTTTEPKKLLVLDTETNTVQIAEQVDNTPPYEQEEAVKTTERKYKKQNKKVKANKKCSECGMPPADGTKITKGLCKKCYQNEWLRKKKEKLEKKPRKMGAYKKRSLPREDSLAPVTSAAHKYRCLDEKCFFEFTSVYEKGEAICPNCGKTEVESLD